MAARLAGPDGRFVEIEILRYEFPDVTEEYGDSNWLLARITASDGQTSLGSTDAAFDATELETLTLQLRRLVRWGWRFEWYTWDIEVIGRGQGDLFDFEVELPQSDPPLELTLSVSSVSKGGVERFVSELETFVSRLIVRAREPAPDVTTFERLKEADEGAW